MLTASNWNDGEPYPWNSEARFIIMPRADEAVRLKEKLMQCGFAHSGKNPNAKTGKRGTPLIAYDKEMMEWIHKSRDWEIYQKIKSQEGKI